MARAAGWLKTSPTPKYRSKAMKTPTVMEQIKRPVDKIYQSPLNIRIELKPSTKRPMMSACELDGNPFATLPTSTQRSAVLQRQLRAQPGKRRRKAAAHPGLHAGRTHDHLAELVGQQAVDHENREGHGHEHARQEQQLRHG